MIRCDVFELEVECADRRLRFRVWSDLPAGTRLILSCDRTYSNHRDQACIWILFDDDLVLQPSVLGDFNGAVGEIEIDAGDRAAARKFEASLSDFSAGIKTPVSDEIVVSAVVGGRQPLRALGSGNRNLDGDAVEESGGLMIVRAERRVRVPVDPRYQPLDSAD